MSRRLVDNRNIADIIRDSKDFCKRNYTNSAISVTYGVLFILCFFVFGMEALYGISAADMTKATVDNLVISLMVIASSFGILVLAFLYLTFKMQKIINVTEFQNLLFASTFSQGSEFCVIFNRENILYVDRKAQDIFYEELPFKYYNDMKMSHILDTIGFSDTVKRKFKNAVNKGEKALLSVGRKSATKSKAKKEESRGKAFSSLQITLEPIIRPKGFFVLRGNLTS